MEKLKYIYMLLVMHYKGKNALMLVPEISLTPQMVSQVNARFGKEVAVLHSGLSEGENMMNGVEFDVVKLG